MLYRSPTKPSEETDWSNDVVYSSQPQTPALQTRIPMARPVIRQTAELATWGVGSALFILLLCLFAEILVSAVIGTIGGIAIALANPTLEINPQMLKSNMGVAVLGPAAVAGQLAGFGVLLFEVSRRRRLPFIQALHLDNWNICRAILCTSIGFGLSFFGLFLCMLFPPPTEPSNDILQMLAQSGASGVAWCTTIALLAPFFEELLFRGFLYSAFRRRMGIVIGGTLVSLIFVSLHIFRIGFYWPALLNLLLLSILLLAARERGRSLTYCICMHFGYNLLPAITMVLAFTLTA